MPENLKRYFFVKFIGYRIGALESFHISKHVKRFLLILNAPMGLTKQYLAYRAIDSFNIIASGRANVNFAIVDKTEGRYVAAPAAENVIVWDLR